MEGRGPYPCGAVPPSCLACSQGRASGALPYRGLAWVGGKVEARRRARQRSSRCLGRVRNVTPVGNVAGLPRAARDTEKPWSIFDQGFFYPARVLPFLARVGV